MVLHVRTLQLMHFSFDILAHNVQGFDIFSTPLMSYITYCHSGSFQVRFQSLKFLFTIIFFCTSLFWFLMFGFLFLLSMSFDSSLLLSLSIRLFIPFFFNMFVSTLQIDAFSVTKSPNHHVVIGHQSNLQKITYFDFTFLLTLNFLNLFNVCRGVL